MPKTIISDTSCLIILDKINALVLLKEVYGEIITTPEIVEEYGDLLPLWIKIKAVKNKSSQKILELQIDKGEAIAIALAIETANSLLILDDFKARKIANNLGIAVTGTVGVIIRAKLSGVIPAIKPLLEKIKNTNFRISEELEKQALIEANENI